MSQSPVASDTHFPSPKAMWEALLPRTTAEERRRDQTPEDFAEYFAEEIRQAFQERLSTSLAAKPVG